MPTTAYIGKNLAITWSSTDYVDNDGNPITTIKIEISRTGSGGSWSTINAAASSTSPYNWTVTGPASTNCYLRFSDPADASFNWLSNQFTILEAWSGEVIWII